MKTIYLNKYKKKKCLNVYSTRINVFIFYYSYIYIYIF